MRYVRSFVLAAVVVAMLAPTVAAQTTSPLPFVRQILIGPKPDLLPVVRPICPDDSIWVRVIGEFPDGCYAVTGIELFPPPYMSPLPEPPWVRVHVERTCGVACPTVITPFQIDTFLPPLPARNYNLVVQLDVRCEGTTDPPDSLAQTMVPFVVERCGGAPETCLWGDWVHTGPGICDATVGPGHPAEVTFTLQSDVALAGLEGRFHVMAGSRTAAPPLVIEKIVPVGPAAGMRLTWSHTPDGARFLLFAESGAPIPPAPLDSSVPPVPVLRLTLVPGGNVVPPRTFLLAGELLGSEDNGNGVPTCPIMTLAIVAANICTEAGCDFNHDGRADICDLVLMVRCLGLDSTEVACDPERFYDCNGDGERSLADVICCARRILSTPSCPECLPDTVPPVLAPEVKIRLGEPTIGSDAVEIPIELEGLEGVGGALVALRFPADRYEAAIVLPKGSPEWLQLEEVGDGEAAIGLVRMAPGGAAGADPILRLTLKAGHTHGGEVAVAESDFSGPAGEPLEVTSDTQVRPLGGPARIALSDARPNPFTGETRFALTLDRAGAATLRVHDLSGRLVATLHDGPLAGGAHSFAWRGAAADGSTAPAGIYFLRAISGGVGVTRKLVRLRD